MRQLFSFATKRDGLRAPKGSRAAAEHRPAFMTWLAVVAGVAICAVATLLT
jgi:hypothetical protein